MDPAIKIKPKFKQIVINLSSTIYYYWVTKYDVISDVADDLDWRVQYSKKKGDWDVLWTDNII